MRTIDLPQLAELLSHVRGTTAVSFVAVTTPDARKTGNPYTKLGGFRKLARVNGMLNTDHGGAVERQQAREGVTDPTYTEQARSWGTRRGAVVEHKGAYYLPVQLHPTIRARPVYLAPKIDAHGKPRLVPIPEAVVAPFLPPDRRAEQAAHQGVDRAVERRDFKLANLSQISIGGQTYRVRS